jgi:hypothetical protein
MLHFLVLKPELELLESERNVDLTEDEADALWTWVRMALDSLVSYVPSWLPVALLIARGSSSGGSLHS